MISQFFLFFSHFQIKELREKRAAERAVQNAFWNEVAAQQRRKAAETDLAVSAHVDICRTKVLVVIRYFLKFI